MVQNNKVLTVSYGTFSCTLEGFEDSFGTMQAIAEYFRDLAADDRYFGAEPPQPDAQMLAQIAQREVTRQVEARTSSEGIHLRAAAPAVAAPAPDVVEAAPAEQPPADAPAEEVVAAPAQEAPKASPRLEDDIAVEPSSVDFFDDNIVDDVAETDAPAPEADTPAAGAVDMAKIAAISAAVEDSSDDTTAEAETGAVELFAETDQEEPVEEETVAEEVAETPVQDNTPDKPAVAKPAADSIAAKLQRIRAVVASTPEEEFSEDEHAESFVETARAELAQEADDANAELEEAIEADSADDEISQVLDRLDLSAHRPDAEEEQTADDAEPAPVGEDSLFGDIADAITSDPEAEGDTDDAEEDDTALIDRIRAESEQPSTEPAASERPRRSIRIARRRPQAEETASVAESTAEESSSAADDSEKATSPQLRARIVKMKRSDLEKVMASGQLEEVEEEQPEAEQTAPPAESSLNDEEEADLMRELAEVEADLLASTQDLESADDDSTPEAQHFEEDDIAETEVEPVAPAAEARNPISSPDSDVSRLMAAAESKLGDPDNAKSRETYSHLRAAVAAAEADPSAKGSETADAEPYREALASVVRPRRPEAGGAGKAARPRAAGNRPAPLKLVAEQRVDPVTQSQPVRPRRVSARQEDPAPVQTTAGSFAEYAQDRGAVELHELLEAAASYLSFVEGRDQFSRPQLINKVRDLGLAEFNREDGLRFFGQLLREGKIERSANGRFAATDDIGFRPAKRAAG